MKARIIVHFPEYQILLIANKYQTGFDHPLLVAMYVDKRFAGVTAVQTLSVPNRICPGKTETFGEEEEEAKLTPLSEIGTGTPREREQAYLSEIIEKMNTFFEGQLTDTDCSTTRTTSAIRCWKTKC